MRPLWEGYVLSEKDRASIRRVGRRSMGRRRFYWRQFREAYWTYIAISPCGTVAKVGRARNPGCRLEGGGFDIRRAERHLGIGRVLLVRAYDGGKGLERECLDFLAPDRIPAEEREWFRVGPRLRVLMNRLDRRFRCGGERESAETVALAKEEGA